MRTEISTFLRTTIDDPTVKVKWFFPEIVVRERQYQMVTKGNELLPSLHRIEKLLGHQLGITAETLVERVKTAIDRQRQELAISVVPLDYSLVDWDSIVRASVERLPPFEAGSKEKGFRDALAIETFMQEVSRSPKSPSVCGLVFVSEDIVVRQALAARAAGMTNVRILANLEELKGLINTLTSEVSEAYVADVRAKAASVFFSSAEETSTLYFTAGIADRIKKEFSTNLEYKPANIVRVTDKKILIARPNFVKKDKSLITWSSQITYQQDLFQRKEAADTSPASLAQQLAIPTANAQIPLSTLLGGYAEQLAGQRELVFDVQWTTRVNTNLKLSAPKIESIKLSEDVEDLI